MLERRRPCLSLPGLRLGRSGCLAQVSTNYAYEITTAEGGCGLDSVLRGRLGKLNGIVNGIDLEEWNPLLDKHIAQNYDMGDSLEGAKAACKAALQRELGLPERPDVPLIGFIGRLDWQKGPELIAESIDRLMSQDCQLVMLGSGRWDMESFLKWAEGAHRTKFRGWVGFSVPVAHRITAGCDILLMPSKFEPCGLNQVRAACPNTPPPQPGASLLRQSIAALLLIAAASHSPPRIAFSPARAAVCDALRHRAGSARHRRAEGHGAAVQRALRGHGGHRDGLPLQPA